MGILTIVLDSAQGTEGRFKINIGRSIPVTDISIVAWSLLRTTAQATNANQEAVRIAIPWLTSSSNTLTGKSNTPDVSGTFLLPINPEAKYESHTACNYTFNHLTQIPSVFEVVTTLGDGQPFEPQFMVLQIEFRQSRLL